MKYRNGTQWLNHEGNACYTVVAAALEANDLLFPLMIRNQITERAHM